MNIKYLAVVMLLFSADLVAAREKPELELWSSPSFRRQFLGTYGVQAEVEPQLDPAEQALMEQVTAAMSGPDGLARSRTLIQKSITRKSSAVLDFTLGNIYFQEEKYPEAVRWFQRAIMKFPTFLRAHKNLGLVQLRQEEFKAARSSLNTAVSLGARDPLTMGLVGFACAAEGDHASAETAYRQAILLQPEQAEWKTGLAKSLFQQNRYGDAVAICNELIAMDPGQPVYRQLKANALLGMKEPMKAALVFEWLHLAGQATAANLNTLGDIYINEGAMDLAADAYVRAMKASGEPPADLCIRNTEVLAARGGYEPARSVIEQVRAVLGDRLSEKEQARLLKVEARIALASGAEEKDHAALMEEIVRLDPLDGDALMVLGSYYARTGELERGILQFERAAAIEKFEADACLRHAQALVKASRYAAAVPLIKRSLELKPRDEVNSYLVQVERLSRSQSGP